MYNSFDFISQKLKDPNLALLLVGVAILFSVYYSAFVYDFGFHTDYRVFEYDNSNPFVFYPELPHLFAIGRWLGGLLLNLHLMLIHDVESMSLWRFVSFLFVVGLFILFSQSLTNWYHIKPLYSFTISLLIFSLPGFQLNTIWLTNLTPGIITIYFSLYAYYYLEKLSLSLDMFRRLALYKALFIFLLSLWIYPPNSMFFLLITVCKLLFKTHQDWMVVRTETIRDLLFVFFSSSVYFVLTKLVVIPLSLYLSGFDSTDIFQGYKYSMSWNLEVFFNKLYEICLFSMQGWEITFSSKTVNSVTILLLASIYIHYLTVKIPHKQRVIYLSQKIFLAIMIFVAVNSPHLAAELSFIAFRTSIISVSFFICLIVWAVSVITNQFGKTRHYFFAVIILICYGVFTARYNMDTMVMNNHLEYKFVKEQFQQAPKNFKTVLVYKTVKPRNVFIVNIFLTNGHSYREKTFVESPLSRELAYTASYPNTFVHGLLYSFFEQLGIDKNKVKIKITYSYKDVLINRRKDDVFILDFSKSSLNYYDYNENIRWNPFALMNPR